MEYNTMPRMRKRNTRISTRKRHAIRGKARYCVSRWTLINERLCMLRLTDNFYNISIICGYAPTEEDTDEVKDLFYEQLDKAYNKLHAYDIKLLLSDFNAQVGKENIYMGTIGKHNLHNVINDNGLW